MELPINQIIQGDSLEVLKTLPSESKENNNMELSYCEICKKPKHYCMCPDFRKWNFYFPRGWDYYYPFLGYENGEAKFSDIFYLRFY